QSCRKSQSPDNRTQCCRRYTFGTVADLHSDLSSRRESTLRPPLLTPAASAALSVRCPRPSSHSHGQCPTVGSFPGRTYHRWDENAPLLFATPHARRHL